MGHPPHSAATVRKYELNITIMNLTSIIRNDKKDVNCENI